MPEVIGVDVEVIARVLGEMDQCSILIETTYPKGTQPCLLYQ